MNCCKPDSSVHRILEARILEWVAIPFTRGSSWPRDRTQVSRTVGRFFTAWTTREDQCFQLTCDKRLTTGFPDGSEVKNPPVMQDRQEMQVRSLGSRRSPGVGNGNLLQYSCLGNPMETSLLGYNPLIREEPDTTLATKQQQQFWSNVMTWKYSRKISWKINQLSDNKFLSTFRMTAKLRRRYRDHPYTPWTTIHS